ncbi:uncharacterized protein [Typha latifolia]|uniref:uncharacterized protein n=1 Tax=Typha latifolia TaxID=4733 RepID=UPI003C2C8448
MASFAKQLSLLFLLLALSSPWAVAGRFFFSKMTRSEDSTETTPLPEATPVVVENNPPEKLPPRSKSGYGLYGKGHEEFSPTTTTELSNENYNDNKYTFDNSHPSFNRGRYETKETYGKPYPSYEETRKQYGMSDTRFMENGRYYYDVNAERYGNGYGSYNRGRGRYGNGNYNSNYNGNEYKNEMEYQNNQENQESEEEYVP